ncbi:MAG: alpha-L-rhamnosidase C-terminal domain-containing protein, partial [Proteiniphilum sp.]
LGWQLAYPYLIKQLYNFYGNTSIICDHFGNLKKQVDFLIDMAHDDLYFAGLSDHEALDDRPIALTSSLFYYHHVKLFAEFAGILNEKEAEKEYTRKSESIRQKIIQHFFNKDGQVDNATQTAQVFALWYQIIQDNKARDNLINKLEESFAKQGWHISTGIFGTKMLFDVLRDLEKEEWAYEIANQPTFPGWGHMLGQGATTLWETWAYSDNMYSQNHPMFGSINEWFYRSILGINAVDPGFKKIMIKPQVPEGLSWASGHYNSIQGRIGSTWKIDEDRFYLDVEIPANTVAEIWLPKNKGTIVYESGLKINDSKRILNKRVETNYIVAQVGSGKYNFQVSHENLMNRFNPKELSISDY